MWLECKMDKDQGVGGLGCGPKQNLWTVSCSGEAMNGCKQETDTMRWSAHETFCEETD